MPRSKNSHAKIEPQNERRPVELVHFISKPIKKMFQSLYRKLFMQTPYSLTNYNTFRKINQGMLLNVSSMQFK